jgi:hypothetical protein
VGDVDEAVVADRPPVGASARPPAQRRVVAGGSAFGGDEQLRSRIGVAKDVTGGVDARHGVLHVVA